MIYRFSTIYLENARTFLKRFDKLDEKILNFYK